MTEDNLSDKIALSDVLTVASIAEFADAAVVSYSRVPLSGHEAKRNIRILPLSCRSAMNFARESVSEELMRNSGSVWRKAFATTNSDGGMPGRMVLSQDPNEAQTSLGATTARYWSSPWATTPA